MAHLFLTNALLVLFTLVIACEAYYDFPEQRSNYDALEAPTTDLNALWKRRRGGSGSDNDDSSSTSSSEDYSSGDNDCCTCWRRETYTREAHNSDSYLSHYPIGNGALDSTDGGYTPDGSGSAPTWDNSTGAWVSLWAYEVNAIDYDQNHLSYSGGASVPYLSGQTSPNGLGPIPFFDMHTIVGTWVPEDDECAIPNSTYAYRYQVRYTWAEPSDDTENWGQNVTITAPVYCCCALESLCGCDDFHENRSFVPALIDTYLRHDEKTAPRNRSSLCVIDREGETTLLVDGTLKNGSTKATRNASYPIQTLTTMTSEYCSPTEGLYSRATKRQTSVPSSTAILVGWTTVSALGFILGGCIVIL
ncbi:uncharacterized protein LDX57_006757 [Aspergillus melleus]|uniref:uncharacterized protein n=1 Tax=Aspergillus melleus TaxID=138277 RepID=UPI001E8CCAAB|nr:uncharacterized protein LDX57_006757 [Aspergillus melleus]KAH8429087.1 hypothetical protein LDX57_006757 [Aspergillus melleus]